MNNLLKDFNGGDLKIFNEEFKDFLPSEIIDSHVHLWKKDFLEKRISEDRQRQNPFLSPDVIGGFTFEDFKNITDKIFPKKKYSGLFFGLPAREINLSRANKYISDVCLKSSSFGLFLPEPDIKEIPKDFFEKRFIGFKPYPDFVDYKPSKDFSKLDIDISLFDFISKEVLEFSEQYRLIVLIHIPRKNRLNDKRNIEEIKIIGKKYPNIKIVLAHAGRSYCYSDIKDSISYLKSIKNLYIDTAMINNFSVNKVLIEELGPERILYGSDLVVAAIKGKNIDINDKHYFITNTPRAWSLSSSEMDLGKFTFFIYEIIRAIRVAAMNLNLKKGDIENIFHQNIERLIKDIIV